MRTKKTITKATFASQMARATDHSQRRHSGRRLYQLLFLPVAIALISGCSHLPFDNRYTLFSDETLESHDDKRLAESQWLVSSDVENNNSQSQEHNETVVADSDTGIKAEQVPVTVSSVSIPTSEATVVARSVASLDAEPPVVSLPKDVVLSSRSEHQKHEKISASHELKSKSTFQETAVQVEQVANLANAKPDKHVISADASTLLLVSNDNERVIAVLNEMTQQNPSAAGVSTEQFMASVQPIKVSVPELRDEIVSAEKRRSLAKLIKHSHLGWKVEENQEDNSEKCRISSPTLQIDRYGYATQVWLDVVNDRLEVNATTNVDISKPGVGIMTSNGVLKKFSENKFPNSVIWSGDLADAIEASDNLTIILGGDELGKRTHEIAIETSELKAAFAAYQQCKI